MAAFPVWVLCWVSVSSLQMPILSNLLATCLLGAKLPVEMQKSGQNGGNSAQKSKRTAKGMDSQIYLISSSKENLERESSGRKGVAYMFMSWSTNGVQINGTDIALRAFPVFLNFL